MPRLNPLDVHASIDAAEVDRDALDDDVERLAHDGDAWHFLRGTWSAGPGGLDHDNFTGDMALRINGDFIDPAQRLATVMWLAQRLNGATPPDEGWARGLWTADERARTVFHSNPERDVGLRLTGDLGSPLRWRRALQGLARQLNGGLLPSDGSL